MIKMVVTDIDGTIYTPENGISNNVKKCIKDMINEVDRFCENVNNLRNTKVIESIVLPICKAKRPKDRHQLTN